MLLKLSQNFDIRNFVKFAVLTNQIYSIEAIVKLAPFCFPACSLRLVLFCLPGSLLKEFSM